jgi:hypothetical protein
LIGDGPRGAIVVHDDLSTITAPELAALAEEIPALKEHGAPARGPSKRSGPASAGVARAAKLSDAPVRVGERSPTYEAMLIEGIGAVEEIEDIDSYLDRKKSVRGEPCAIFAHDVTYRSVSAEGMEMHMHSRGEEAIRLVDSKVADSTSNAEIEFEKPATDDESAPTTGTGTVRVAQTIDYR